MILAGNRPPKAPAVLEPLRLPDTYALLANDRRFIEFESGTSNGKRHWLDAARCG